MKRSNLILVVLLLVILPCTLMASKKSDKVPEKGSKTVVAPKSDQKQSTVEKERSSATQNQPLKEIKPASQPIDILPVEVIENDAPAPAPSSPETGETISWQVLSSGATDAISTSYHLLGTLGQVAVGIVSSASYTISQGYWQNFDSGPPSCCGQYVSGFTGNTDCTVDGKRNLADITSLIDHVYISKAELCCDENGNTDGDPEGKANLADITTLIDHVYISKAQTAACL